MKYILCYGDSNTWGCVPATFERFAFADRWPGRMQAVLGDQYHVYENALNGRTTVFHDPIEEGRNGRLGFETVMESNAPLDLLILMLGTNDTKDRFQKSVQDIALGMELLVHLAQKSGCVSQILIASPIHCDGQWGDTIHGDIFSPQSVEKSAKLAPEYRKIAERNGCAFLDAAEYAKASGDGVHMSREGQRALGEAMAQTVRKLLA